MIIPLNLHDEKDKQLIEFLKTKTNRSAYIREMLYRDMKGFVPEVKEAPGEQKPYVNKKLLGKLMT